MVGQHAWTCCTQLQATPGAHSLKDKASFTEEHWNAAETKHILFCLFDAGKSPLNKNSIILSNLVACKGTPLIHNDSKLGKNKKLLLYFNNGFTGIREKLENRNYAEGA